MFLCYNAGMFGRKIGYILLLLSPIPITGLIAYAVTGDGGRAFGILMMAVVAYFVIWRYRHINWAANISRTIGAILVMLILLIISLLTRP